MAKYRIAWLEGDGIGKEVMEAARIVLDKLNLDAEYVKGDVGWEFWKKEGNALPERTVKVLKNTDCCLFGAITSKPKQEAEKELNPELKGKGYVYYSPIVKLRQDFNLHTNMRPCKAYKGNPTNYRDNIDLVIFRENTEGLYSGVEFYPLPQDLMNELRKHPKMKRFKDTPLMDIALSCRIITRKGARTVIGGAFEYARKHEKKSVTLIEKPNVLRETSGLMTREARDIAKQYPEIKLWERNIDAMCQLLLVEPEKYSVLVASNLFGDIISDLSAQISGGLGFAASANIGDNYALFEPTHGSAPDIAGQRKANPIAMLLSVGLMFDYLEEKELADKLENAIAQVIEEGKIKTFDMGGTSTTLDVVDEVVGKL
jgi:3-isopropylmalate dehydrogenase